MTEIGVKSEKASWKRGRLPSEGMDDVLLCMNLSCSNLFDIGWGIQVLASQWLVRGQLLAHVLFFNT